MAKTPAVGYQDISELTLSSGANTLKVTAEAASLKLAESDKAVLSETVEQGSLKFALKEDGTYKVTGIGTMSGAIEIPNYYVDNYVTEIAENAFENCDTLTGVIIPNTVRVIGISAFAGSGLKSVTFRDKDEIIVYFKNTPGWLTPYAEYNCESTGEEVRHNLKMVHFKGDAEGIYCINVPLDTISISFNSGDIYETTDEIAIKSILEKAPNIMFTPSKRNTSTNKYAVNTEYFYAFPSSLYLFTNMPGELQIRGHAFRNCTSLTEVTMPRRVTWVGTSVFAGCENLTKCEYSNYSWLTYIEDGAFKNCTNLLEVNLPLGVARLGASAYTGCTSLVTFRCGETLTEIGASAFSGCSGLKNITFGYSGDLPMRLTSIQREAFMNCTGLAATFSSDNPLHIPTSVEFIADGAFFGAIYEYTNDFNALISQRLWLEFDDKYTWFEHNIMPFNHAVATGTAYCIPPEKMDLPGVLDKFSTVRGIYYTKLKKMLPPTLSLDGNTLIMEDKLGLAERFYIYVNDNTDYAVFVNPKAIS